MIGHLGANRRPGLGARWMRGDPDRRAWMRERFEFL